MTKKNTGSPLGIIMDILIVIFYLFIFELIINTFKVHTTLVLTALIGLQLVAVGINYYIYKNKPALKISFLISFFGLFIYVIFFNLKLFTNNNPLIILVTEIIIIIITIIILSKYYKKILTIKKDFAQEFLIYIFSTTIFICAEILLFSFTTNLETFVVIQTFIVIFTYLPLRICLLSNSNNKIEYISATVGFFFFIIKILTTFDLLMNVM